MARWAPDARGRLAVAALELFADPGFDQTTVADIAARAGVTERTFFRHFGDKREVLFDRSERLESGMVTAIAAAGDGVRPLDAVVGALAATAGGFLDHAWAQRRAGVVAATPSLQERELLKMAALASAGAAALRQRGVPDLAAALAAESGVAVFKAGFERWVAGPADVGLAERMAEALAELRAAVGET